MIPSSTLDSTANTGFVSQNVASPTYSIQQFSISKFSFKSISTPQEQPAQMKKNTSKLLAHIEREEDDWKPRGIDHYKAWKAQFQGQGVANRAQKHPTYIEADRSPRQMNSPPTPHPLSLSRTIYTGVRVVDDDDNDARSDVQRRFSKCLLMLSLARILATPTH